MLLCLSLMCCCTMMFLWVCHMEELLVAGARCGLMGTLMAWISYMSHLCMRRGSMMCSMHCFDVMAMRLRYFVRVSNRFRYWFMVLGDCRMDRGLRRIDLDRMSISRDDWDLVFLFFDSFTIVRSLGFLVRRYWNMVLRYLVMYGYFLMSYCGLCWRWLLVDNRWWSMLDCHRFFLM